VDVVAWHKHSSPTGDNCVEVGALQEGTGVAVRNSKQPDGPAIVFTWSEWLSFLAGVKLDQFGQERLSGHVL
jgi:hypothetical protein